jgi:tetratricopeptide (TPR) repeat protein
LPGRVRVLDVTTGQAVGPDLPSTGLAARSFFSRDGRLMGRWTFEPRMGGAPPEVVFRVLDVTTGRWRSDPLRTLNSAAAFNLKKGLAVAVQNEEPMGATVQVWDLATGRPAFAAQRYAETVSVEAVSDDGRLLLAVHEGTSEQVRDVATGEPVGAARPLPGSSRRLAFSPGNDRLLCLSYPPYRGLNEGRVELWEINSSRQVVRLPKSDVIAVDFSPDGTRVVTVAADYTARVWEAASGRPVTPPLEHREDIRAARFSPDGRHLVTLTTTGSVRLWDVSTGEPLSPPLGREALDAVADGDGRLVTLVYYRSVRIWDVTPETRSLDQLRLLAQVLSGSRLDGAGGLVQLDDEEYARAWQAVRESGGPSDEVLRRQRLGWHAAEATRQEQAHRWAVAVEHLTPLIEAQPHRAWLYARRGQALRALRRWGPADADLTAALERTEDDRSLWIDRGHVRAELARWKEAADDFARAEAAGAEGMTSLQVKALLAAGDLPAVRRVWARLLQGPGDVTEWDGGGDWWGERNAMAWAGLLRPEAGLGVKPLIVALRNNTTNDHKNADVRRTLGLASLRAGKPDDAVKWLDEAVALRETFPSAWLLLAMAHHRAGDVKQAGEWLKKATDWLAVPGQFDRLDWQERLELRLLREEAEALLKDAKRSTP